MRDLGHLRQAAPPEFAITYDCPAAEGGAYRFQGDLVRDGRSASIRRASEVVADAVLLLREVRGRNQVVVSCAEHAVMVHGMTDPTDAVRGVDDPLRIVAEGPPPAPRQSNDWVTSAHLTFLNAVGGPK